MNEERERRILQNELTFRAINDRLGELNDAFSLVADTLVVVCECGDPSCLQQIRIAPNDYEAIRADPLLFIVGRGHEVADVERVVESRGEYDVIRKREERLPAR